MGEIAGLLKFMKLYAHMSHNLCKGDTFFQDHSFLGELYEAYGSRYDDVIERMVGLDENPDIININKFAVDELSDKQFQSNRDSFQLLYDYEMQLKEKIENLIDSLSQGSLQLFGDIANESEMRCYKLQQRLKD